ncbi:hypothetical protein [Bacillus massiliigorillae]|uniref:hypothetical protein n=1 Tax=Bacillus massiliigorillae TaxID=1243664 RepID=UPI00039ECD7D|nr:hypothetical protein [Bacillus massiliigorillae]
MTNDNIIRLNFKLIEEDAERVAKFDAFAKEVVRLNMEHVTHSIENRLENESV